MERLGPAAFAEVYELIKAHSLLSGGPAQPQEGGAAAAFGGGGLGSGADDEALQQAVERLLRPELLAYWPLVDQLIFMEELNEMR